MVISLSLYFSLISKLTPTLYKVSKAVTGRFLNQGLTKKTDTHTQKKTDIHKQTNIHTANIAFIYKACHKRKKKTKKIPSK